MKLLTATGYNWKKQENGKYSVFNIPIFSEVKDTRKNGCSYDKNWIREAIDFQKNAQKTDKNYPAVFVGHSNRDKGELIPIAYLANFRSGYYNEKLTIFGDIIDFDKESFDYFRDGKLPFHSVEIPRPEFARIGGLALLSSTAPYFTFPNHIAGEEVFSSSKEFICFSDSNKTEIIFKDFDKGEKFMERMKREHKVKNIELVKPVNKMMEEEEKTGHKVMEEEENSLKTTVEDRLKKLEENMEKILEAIGGSEEKTPPPISPGAYENEKNKGSMNVRASFSAEVAKEVASVVGNKISDLESKVVRMIERSSSDDFNLSIQNSIQKFSELGLNFDPDDFKNEALEYRNNFGEKVANHFIKNYENYLVPSPNSRPVEFSSANSNNDLTKYQGSKLEAVAMKAMSNFKQNLGDMNRQGVSQKDWIDGQVAKFCFANNEEELLINL